MVSRITQYSNKEACDVHVWEMEEEKQLKSWKSVLVNFRNMNKEINVNPSNIEELIDNLNRGSKYANECGLTRFGEYFYRVSTDEDVKIAEQINAYNKR